MADWTQIGIGATVAVILREIFAFILTILKKQQPASHQDSNASGSRPVEYWELTFQRIFKACLREHDQKVRQPSLDAATEERQELKREIGELKETVERSGKSLERQLALAVAEIARSVRDR